MPKKAKPKRCSAAELLVEMCGEPTPTSITLNPDVLGRLWRDGWADDFHRDLNQTIAETIGSKQPVCRTRRARAVSALHWLEAAIQAINAGNPEAAALAGTMAGFEHAADGAAAHFELASRGLSYIEAGRRKVERTTQRNERIRTAFRAAKRADPTLDSSKWRDARIEQEKSLPPSDWLVTIERGRYLSKSRIRTICQPHAASSRAQLRKRAR